MGKSIGVISLKGGVGKTSVVVALGSAIAGFGKKVLLVDGNLTAPNLGMHLNIFNSERTLHHVLHRRTNPSDAVHNLENFDVLPASLFYKSRIEPMVLKKRLGHLKRSYDIILIDSSPAMNEETLAAMLASDELLVVTTPDLPTLGVTIKAIKEAKQRDAPIIGLVLNRVYNRNFEIPLKEIEENLEIPVMAVIPYDINILKSLSEFKPSTEHKPRSQASEEYKRLAAVLIGEKYKPARLRNLFAWISPKKQDINRTIFYETLFK